MQAVVLGTPTSRARTLSHALRLEYLTVGWNVIEGVVAIAAALAAGSVALLAFGIDSFVECASGAVLIWRLRAEKRAKDAAAVARLDRRAHQLVGWSLFALAAWVVVDASTALSTQEHADPSVVGIVMLVLSIAAMYWLARAKRRAAAALQSRALEADSFQTSACFWLSVSDHQGRRRRRRRAVPSTGPGSSSASRSTSRSSSCPGGDARAPL